jgi:hypothetical protein
MEDSDDEFYYGNGNDDYNDDNQWFTAAPSDEQELSEIGRVIMIFFYCFYYTYISNFALNFIRLH